MATNKDHEDVTRFRSAFQRLREMIDDDPATLEALAANDDTVKKQCLEIDWAATVLKIAEERDRQKLRRHG